MCSFVWRSLGFAGLLISGAVLILFTIPLIPNLAFALNQAPASIVVTAVVAPVRYVLVNQNIEIIEILSNTPLNVPPKVYQSSFKSNEIPLTTPIDKSYRDIIVKINTSKTGVIYSRQANQPVGLISMDSLRSLSKIESVLFKTKQ